MLCPSANAARFTGRMRVVYVQRLTMVSTPHFLNTLHAFTVLPSPSLPSELFLLCAFLSLSLCVAALV